MSNPPVNECYDSRNVSQAYIISCEQPSFTCRTWSDIDIPAKNTYNLHIEISTQVFTIFKHGQKNAAVLDLKTYMK